MKIVKLFLLALCLTLGSCTTTTSFFEVQNRNARIVEPKFNGCDITPIAADLEISQNRITFQVQYDFERAISMQDYQVKAISDASIEHKCDVIVGALTQSKSSDYGKKLNITVTGYPASYKNLRTATKEDIISIKTAQGKIICPEKCTKSIDTDEK